MSDILCEKKNSSFSFQRTNILWHYVNSITQDHCQALTEFLEL